GFRGIEAIGLNGFSMTGGAIHGGRIGVNVWSLAGYEANGDLSFAGVDFAGNRTHLVLEDAGADLNQILAGNSFDRTVHATGADTIRGDLSFAGSDAAAGGGGRAANAGQAGWLVEQGVNFGLSDPPIAGGGADGTRVTYAIRNHGHTTIDNVAFQNIVDGSRAGIAVASFGGVVAGGGGA